MKRAFLFSLVLASSFSLAQPREMIGARSLALSPDGTQLAFTWRGDIWVAPSGGGRAIAITTNVEMDDNPVWSPDGKSIAFASDRFGNWDIFLAPVEGGEIRRLTFSGTSEVPNAFTPDGKRILYRGFYDKPENGIYSMDIETGRIHEHWLDPTAIGYPVMSPNGASVAFVRRFQFPWNRPRYEGSAAAAIQLLDVQSGQRTSLRDTQLQHLWLNWAPDGRALFAVTATEKTPSTRNILREPPVRIQDNAAKTPNVHRIGLDGRATRLTQFVGGAGARFLTVALDSGLMAFERDGAVFTMTAGQEPKRIRLTGNLDDKGATEERLVLTNGVQADALSPKGDQAIVQVRSELWQVPVRKGRGPNADDAIQLTDWEGLDEQPLWTADEKTIFFVSDREGAGRLYRMNLETRVVTPVTTGDYDVSGMQLTPDRKHVAYWVAGPKGGLFMVPTEGGEPKKILDRPHRRGYAFSPDMRYLAYERELPNSGFNPWENRVNLWVRDLTTGQEVNATNLSAFHSSPAWSADGRYLFFRSDRDGTGIFVLPLQPEAARPTELELRYERPKETPKLDFDMNQPWQRIRRFYTGPVLGNLVFDPVSGGLLFNQGGDIWRVDYDGENARAITGGGGIFQFDFSQDFNQLHFIRGDQMQLLSLRQNGFPTSPVTFRADWTRRIDAERRAAFNQFYRIYNLEFYDENFHGRDWAEIRNRYRPLLDSVSHRREMATVLNMMVGELESSHAEVSPAGGGNRSQSTAHLGFTIDFSYAGPGIRVKSVPNNAPGSFTRTRIGEGEYILSVNGQDVKADQNLWRVLNEQTGREARLLVNRTPTKTGAREVRYRLISDGAFDGLVYRNWIDSRRAMVDSKSQNQLAYLHISAMGGGNFAQFDAEVWQYVQGRKGLIIDVRNNNGGNIADRLLDILERRPQMLYLPRDGELLVSPGTTVNRPIVVLFNERSVSNGEMFPAAMRSRGLATTIGWPTPGYVIYTSGGVLVDGTGIRLPGTGVYRVDGSPLENNGERPEIAVELTPEQFFAGQDPQLERAIQVLTQKTR